jgi:5-methylcytosine-specific restriction endonuclease McrA
MSQYDKKRLRKDQINIGDLFPTKHWGYVEIICNKNTVKLGIRFLNTGNEYVCRHRELKAGMVRDKLEYERLGKIESYICPKHVASRMEAGEIYSSNYWGDVEILDYTSSKEVLIKFLNSGNTMIASRDNILKGLIKDKELSKSQTKIKHDAERMLKAETRERAEALARELKKIEDEDIAAKKIAAQSRSRWYKIMRDFKCHFDANGLLLAGTDRTDRNGFVYKVIIKKSFDSLSWAVWYHSSGNTYWVFEQAAKDGTLYDKLSEEGVKAEKYRLKIANTEKYESDRERRIAMASEYQRKNVERTRVRNRNRRARRVGAEGTHTLEEVLCLLDSQDNKCACCQVELTEETRELDHVMPLILGGTNSIENLQWLCQFCNSSKSGSHPDDWAAYSTSDEFRRRRLERLSTSG